MNTEIPITLFAADGTVKPDPGIDPETERILRDVYQIVIEIPGFPTADCPTAVDLLYHHGLEPESGWFLVDRLPNENSMIERFLPHFWNTNANRDSIYDLTLPQFNPYLFEPLPKGLIVVEMGNPLYQKYINRNNPLAQQLGLATAE